MTDKTVIKIDNVKTGFGSITKLDTFEVDKYVLQLMLGANHADSIAELTAIADANASEHKANGLSAKTLSLETNSEKFPDQFKEGDYTRIKVKSKFQPKVVDAQGNEVTDIPYIPVGSTVNAIITAVPYVYNKSGGTSLYLSALQIVELAENKGSDQLPEVSFSTTGGSFLTSGPTDIDLN